MTEGFERNWNGFVAKHQVVDRDIWRGSRIADEKPASHRAYIAPDFKPGATPGMRKLLWCLGAG